MLLLAGSVAAADGAAGGDYPAFKWGADLRVRQEYFDEIPIRADPPGVTRGGENNYLRVRPRLWGQVDFDKSSRAYGRLANEFRHVWQPEEDEVAARPWDYPDEVVVDQLYLDWKGLFGDRLDVRVGRQDLMYGNGRVILEGTPKDGSRTIYFDAVKASYRGLPDNTIDFLAIYNTPENELAMSRENRDLTGQTGAYNDITEWGGGVYWKSNTRKDLPFEAYYLYKVETDWMRGATYVPELDLHTVGGRLMPKFGPSLDANLELAYQLGERDTQDVSGYMVDAALNWKPPVVESWKPKLGVGWYLLSGNDPDTSDDEGWNPLWARWPQYSELYTYAWDADGAVRWSNLSMPHLDLQLSPTSWYRADLMAAYLWAMEDDGPGSGKDRGFLFTWWNRFTLGEKLLTGSDKLTGHLLLEVLEPGNYYNVDDTSVFARWEFLYAF
jgi:hypothetical protein